MHWGLIEVARQLAELDPGRPRQVSLRRAVSTAYYATFHAICRLCADELVGSSSLLASWEDWAAIYRTVDHGALRARHGAAGLSDDIHLALGLVVELQKARLDADYDPRPRSLGRGAVRALIASAEEAIRVLEALSPKERRTLAVALVARPRRP